MEFGNVRLKGAKEFRGADQPEIARIAKTQPRIDTEVLKWDPRRAAQGQRPRWSRVNNSHMFEWALACAGDAKSYSPFEIGAQITEIGMLGVLALRMQKPIVWDAAKRKAVGLPEADMIIDPQPRSAKVSANLGSTRPERSQADELERRLLYSWQRVRTK